jgi:lysophospholipase L1-like esterase
MLISREDVDPDGFLEPARVHPNPGVTLMFLGGSTTEARFVKPELRFPYLSGRLIEQATGLRVTALNGGRSGNDTRHALHILATKGLSENPTHVVLMEAINDLGFLAYNGAYWSNESRPPASDPARTAMDRIGPGRTHIVPGRRVARLWVQETLQRPGLLWNLRNRMARIVERIAGAAADEWAEARDAPRPADPEAILADYSSSVESFIMYCRAWKIEPILMTQFERIRDGTGTTADFAALYTARGLTRERVARLHESMNQRVRDLGERFGVVVIDLARAIPKDSRHMYDEVHLTNEGSVVAAEAIASALTSVLKNEAR